MLKGLEVAEVSFSKIDLNDRIDAEYFHKDSLDIQNILEQKGSIRFDTFGDFVASAFYPAATHLYEIGDLPFIRCVDCISFPYITSNQNRTFEKIPTEFAVEQKGISILTKGEMVITKVGSPCYASLVYDIESVALSRTVLGLKNIRNIEPNYLLAFLRSKYGFNQLLRQRELTIQYQLTLERVKNILVYTPNSELQKVIGKNIMTSTKRMVEAENVYRNTEETLLSYLKLDKWQPKQDKISIKSLSSSFKISGRLDAEFYQPKYDELVNIIRKIEHKTLGSIASFKKSIEPGSDAYQTEGIPFIRVSDISKFGLSEPEIHIDREIYNDETLKPKKDTILLSKDGSVGIAYKVEQDLDVITSSALLHLTITDKEVLPDYLTLVLNSKLTQMQAERDAGGSIIQHWRPDEIKQVLIPILPMDTQKELVKQIQQSFKLRQESTKLIDIAKQAVEIAIEQDENTALKFIKDNT
ncbi:MAG: restriction endonuclease subunit S [Cytophagales bacterium]